MSPAADQPLLALWAPSQPSWGVGWGKEGSGDLEIREGAWPSSGSGELSRSLSDLREGQSIQAGVVGRGSGGASLLPSTGVRCTLLGCRTERTGMNDLQSSLLVMELGKMILFCPEHYQVNCTSPISIGNIHMKLWNSWWLCLGNRSFLMGSSITHEFNSKQCYQQIQMIYILGSPFSLSHT